jgi:hypothetical protein
VTLVLNRAGRKAVLTHRLGEVSLDNAFALIEGHPPPCGIVLRAPHLEQSWCGRGETGMTATCRAGPVHKEQLLILWQQERFFGLTLGESPSIINCHS